MGCSSVSRPRFLIAASSRAMINGFARIEDIRGGQAGGILAAADENGLGGTVGEQIAPVADTLDDQRDRDVVDHEFENFLLFSSSREATGDR